MKRVFARVIYLAASLLWALFMTMAQAMRCDDSCTAAQFARDWHDNPDSWQYGVVGWLGAAGLALAVLAVCLSLVRRWLGAVFLLAHGCVFMTNCLVWYLGRTIYGSFVPFALAASVVAAAGVVAADGWPRRPSRLAAD